MTTEFVPYIGNGPYCYANAMAMLLANRGEQIEPALVEVLTGVGLGAMWIPEQRIFFFSMEAPDVGVSRALEVLGFTVVERAYEDGDPPPFGDLAEALTSGPAMLGPLDMGLLTYAPGRGTPLGADHYVLAYGLSDGEVQIHDPAGFPHVSLPLANLEEAWRARLIGYRRGAFRWWSCPRRVRDVAADEIAEQAIQTFQGIYRRAETASGPDVILGSAAIRQLVNAATGGDLSPWLVEHMVGFLFQLGARRAMDYAAFFEGQSPALARMKHEQAVLFGRCHMRAVREDWSGLAGHLESLADIEERFRDTLLASA